MPNTAPVTQRVDPQVKAEAIEILSHYGITLIEAYNMFLHKIVMERGIPFDLRPGYQEFQEFNDETIEAIEEAMAIERGDVIVPNYETFEEMLDDILSTEE